MTDPQSELAKCEPATLNPGWYELHLPKAVSVRWWDGAVWRYNPTDSVAVEYPDATRVVGPLVPAAALREIIALREQLGEARAKLQQIVRTSCDPEAAGRKPQPGDVRFTIQLPLEHGEFLTVMMGKKGRDLLFGMLIADCHDSQEAEPA